MIQWRNFQIFFHNKLLHPWHKRVPSFKYYHLHELSRAWTANSEYLGVSYYLVGYKYILGRLVPWCILIELIWWPLFRGQNNHTIGMPHSSPNKHCPCPLPNIPKQWWLLQIFVPRYSSLCISLIPLLVVVTSDPCCDYKWLSLWNIVRKNK